MRKKKVAPLDPDMLISCKEYIRRAAREHGLRFKSGRRVEALAYVYNMFVLGLFKDYAGFVTLIKCELDKAKK